MNDEVNNLIHERWIKVGGLIIDLPSMEKGFLEMERRRQEIWDYIQYRESLLTWPFIEKEAEKSS